MSTAPSKFSINSFETGTKIRFPLVKSLLLNMEAQFEQAAEGNGAFQPALTSLTNQRTSWLYGNTSIINAEATQLSSTLAVEAKLESMSHKPDVDTPSPLDTWDNTIQAVAPKGGTLYKLLLPHGRETLTGGKIDDRVSELTAFALRLTQQGGQPTLVALGKWGGGRFQSLARSTAPHPGAGEGAGGRAAW